MGTPRLRPARLAAKLAQVRAKLELSQAELADALSDRKASVIKGDISSFENGVREPSLIILLRYARLGGVTVEELIDDKLNLPR